MPSRTLALAAALAVIGAATPTTANAWRSHDRRDCDQEDVVVVVDPPSDGHPHQRVQGFDRGFQGMPPYWGTMRPYWGPNEPPGVIHRQLRTEGLKISPRR